MNCSEFIFLPATNASLLFNDLYYESNHEKLRRLHVGMMY